MPPDEAASGDQSSATDNLSGQARDRAGIERRSLPPLTIKIAMN